jgi:glucuronate isomerase
VAPTFRTDKALNIEKPDWRAYVELLSQVSDITIDSPEALKQALGKRIDFFDRCGCKASDHGLDYMIFRPADPETVRGIMEKALSGASVTLQEAEMFKTDLLLFCAACYRQKGWVLQLHYNCLRNPNSKALAALGPDTGFDCIGPNNGSQKLAQLLDHLNRENALPKTILYSLDPGDNAFLDTLIGAFQGTEAPGKLQHGSAWWFNDNKRGMEDQLISLANLSLLGNFVGMLTDSRSFLSYTRHEYFRRILCSLIGKWVEEGEYPNDPDTLKTLVQGICFYNAKNYFGI